MYGTELSNESRLEFFEGRICMGKDAMKIGYLGAVVGIVMLIFVEWSAVGEFVGDLSISTSMPNDRSPAIY